MSFDYIKKVDYELYASAYRITQKLPEILEKFDLLSFDTETRSVYDKNIRKEASDFLKDAHASEELYQQARVVSNSSGLSYPSIVNTTHFIFGESKTKSHVVICNTPEMEMFVWNLISKYKGTLLIHNSLFDLKIYFERLRLPLPKFIDTAILVKCMINHVDIWKAKVGLKELMGPYYDPKWSLYSNYEPEKLTDLNFIVYCSIDGAATVYLWEIVQAMLEDIDHD